MKSTLDKNRRVAGSLFVFFIFLSAFVVFSCDNPFIQRIVDPKTVTFESNGGSGVEKQTVFKGQAIRRPSDPSRSGFIFEAWFSDNETFLNEWDFAVVPDTNITLYAKWNAEIKLPITEVAIIVTWPETDAVPNTTAGGSGDFTIGEVSWSPNDNPFKAGVEYTASVTLTAHQGYAFESELTTATINENDAAVISNTGNNLTLSYTFPPTRTVINISINMPPTKMSYTHGDTLNLSGLLVTIEYDDGGAENVAFSNFASRGISVSPVNGTVLSHSIHNGQPVTINYGGFTQTAGNLTVSPKVMIFTDVSIPAQTYTGNALTPAVTVRDGATILTPDIDYTVTYSNNTDVGTATVTISGAGNYLGSTGSATFAINKANITSAAITVTGPAKNGIPITMASGTGNFTISPVTWSPNDTMFKGSTAYTASVTLTANTNYAFASTLTATINTRNATVVNNVTTLTLSYTFPNTEARAVYSISIKTQPKLTYAHGDTLDLSSLVVTLTYDDGTADDVAFSSFASRNITASPANGAVLSCSTHDGKPITITYGSFSQTTDNLTVNPKVNTNLTVTVTPATYPYTGSAITPTTVTVRDGTTALTLTADYTVTYTDNINAGTATANISGAGNYAGSTGSATFAITKIAPTVNWPTGLTATYGQTLANINLPNNGSGTPGVFSWTAVGTTSVGNVGPQSHNMTFTPADTANYNTVTNNVTVTVAKAAGANVAAPTADTIGANSVTLNAVTAPSNGQTVEYARSDTATAPANGWQTGLTFIGLTGGTPYYFFARSASNANYEAGEASSGTLITTMQNVGITITLDVSELIDKAPNFDSGIIIYRSTSTPQTTTIPITGTYDSIYWEIPGVGAHSAQKVSENSSPITLDATNVIYNSPGYHPVIVRVMVNGMEYQNSFRFRIVE